MAPQLEASGAEPTLATCVQTALRSWQLHLAWEQPATCTQRGFYTQGGGGRGGGAPSVLAPPPPCRSWALALGGVSK